MVSGTYTQGMLSMATLKESGSVYILWGCYDLTVLFPQHNVLIHDDGTPRLSDFGRSKFIDHRGFTTSFSGSSRYMAPELTMAESDVDYDDDDNPVNDAPPKLTKETDVFAFSMVALEVSYPAFEVHFILTISGRS